MSVRKTNKRRLFKYSIGDLRYRVSFYNREILPVGSGGHEQDLTDVVVKWAGIKSLASKHLFSEVNIDPKQITHEIVIRYDSNITSEKITKLDGNIYKIVNIDDPDLRKEFMVLYVHLEGSEDKEATA